jgi:hypothetical protein
VCRTTGAAELEISPDTWDQWVADGLLPATAPGFPESTPRWRWADVDAKLSGKIVNQIDPYMQGLDNLGSHGQTKNATRQ